MNKDILVLRLINVLTINLSFFLAGLGSFSRGDVVIVVTNPPSLPFVICMACRIKNARCVIRVDDVYPDVLRVSGVLSHHSQIYKIMVKMTKWLFIRAEKIITLGRDTYDLLAGRLGDHPNKLCLITNWADVQSVWPNPEKGNKLLKRIGLDGKFVVLYAGNIGRVQGIEHIFEAIVALGDRDDIHFLFIGAGAKRSWLERNLKKSRLTNATILEARPRSEQVEFLNACDVALSALKPGMLGVSVPSRMYNIFAAGKPIIAVADLTSEISLTVKEEKLGWVVEPGDVQGLVSAILSAQAQRSDMAELGRRARRVAELRFARPLILASYSRLIDEIQGQ